MRGCLMNSQTAENSKSPSLSRAQAGTGSQQRSLAKYVLVRRTYDPNTSTCLERTCIRETGRTDSSTWVHRRGDQQTTDSGTSPGEGPVRVCHTIPATPSVAPPPGPPVPGISGLCSCHYNRAGGQEARCQDEYCSLKHRRYLRC